MARFGPFDFGWAFFESFLPSKVRVVARVDDHRLITGSVGVCGT